MIKNKKTNSSKIEKTLAIAGSALVVLGCIASIHYGYVNQGFIDELLLDSFYYFKYVVLLGGGFATGYLLTRKNESRLFSGAAYALLASSIYSLMEIMRLAVIRNLFGGTLPFPWETIIFELGPLFALVITILIAIVLQRRAKQTDFSLGAKWIFIISFAITQVYYLVVGLYALSDSGPYAMPIWLVIGNYLINPILINLLAYVLLNRVKGNFQRLFYSVFVGSFPYIFFQILWNFRTDPSLSATNTFETNAIIITLAATGLLLWQVRLATKH